MKDQNDTSTTELFEVPKKRGRPSTGKALSAAERQAKHRYKKYSEENRDRLDIWIDGVCKLHLDGLAKRHELSTAEMLEKIIRDAL